MRICALLPALELRAKKQRSGRSTAKASDPEHAKAPKRRICRYYLRVKGHSELLGQTIVPEGMDTDDAFPAFHAANFPPEHYEHLILAIKGGGALWAESDFGEESSALAYTMGDPDYWYGREATLKYLGITNYQPAVA